MEYEQRRNILSEIHKNSALEFQSQKPRSEAIEAVHFLTVTLLCSLLRNVIVQ